jgi:hypothetical protein
MRRLIETLRQRWIALGKTANDIADVFRPKNMVEARLIYAHGPQKGEVYKTYKGRNVVTSWLSLLGAAPTSGRDMMRRKLVPPGLPGGGSLAGDTDAVIGQMALGNGTTAETAGDTGLDNILDVGTYSPIEPVVDVEYDLVNPHVTFIAEWDETQANTTIAEAGLYSTRTDGVSPVPTDADFIARKTFGGFDKTSDFTLQIRWTIRF